MSFTGDPRAFASYGQLTTEAGQPIDIVKLKPAKDEFICTLRDVTDRNMAEALKGASLFAKREQLPDETLLADLLGRKVTAGATVLGTIAGYQNFGAGELMELDTGMLIPVRFLDPVTMAVDLPAGFQDKE